MLNHITLMGRLVADPEKRYTQSNKPVTSFRIATDRDFDKDHKADFFPVVAWNNTAEFCSKYFKKGSMIAISGRLQTREWTDKNENKRIETEIIAESVYFCENKRSESKPANNAPINTQEADEELPF